MPTSLAPRKFAQVAWSNHAPVRRRSGVTPRHWVDEAFGTLIGLGLGVAIALVVTSESWSTLASPGGWFDAAGRLCAMVGSYLMMVMVLLIARIPWLERVVGQDQLVRWHRRIGGWPIGLIALHIVFVTLGYAKLTNASLWSQTTVFILHYPDILASLVGFGLLVLAGVTSFRIARHKMKYETWWVVHLYIYVALMLAFAHQVATGVMFIGHPLARWYWTGLWAGVALTVLLSRVLMPVWRNLRYQLRIAHVSEEAPGVYSLTIAGRNLSRLAVSGGQFFQWRFLAKDLWWHAHPYSLSALPRPPHLRVTIKALGDQSSAVAQLRPGTRVFVEGPYGAFTRHVRRSQMVTLIGAGVGITPLRALLEDLPKDVHVTVVVRASTPEDLVHREEIQTLVKQRHGELHEVIGSRRDVMLRAETLIRLAPQIAKSDVYVCGPSGFTDSIAECLHKLRVDPQLIHVEEFSF